ncbi:outer membrane protein [Rickettsia endosymbiont of Polydrusus tereticollis]|uniref:outer membrane protein n=1 Tax=Rickettsia endosymbiont of Polydrusus tereticollis TaxID=3066251 RepID=UPI003132E835
MKKLLLIAAASATILSSTLSFADCAMDTNQTQNENQWYLKANAGASMFDKVKVDGQKLKSNTTFTGEIGAGYYIMKNIRADLTLGTVNPVFKTKTPYTSLGVTVNSVKIKPTIVNLLVNGYVDFVDLGVFKLFAGGGIGTAMVKEKATTILVNRFGGTFSSTSSTKTKSNFAYQLSLGASAEVVDGVKAELVYSWRDYGKGNESSTTKLHYKGHNVMAGIRFDI